MTYSLNWIREDGQGSYDMGTFDTRAAAEADVENAKAQLLAAGPTSEPEATAHAADVSAGTFEISGGEADRVTELSR